MPKVGTPAERDYSIHHERKAVEENLGFRPGSPTAKIVGAVVIVVGIVAMIAFVALR